MDLRHSEVLGAVADAAVAMGAQSDAASTLQEMVRQARRCLPEFEHVSVARILPDRTLETLAATTDLAREFDAIQSEVQAGPCIAAAGHQEEVVVVRPARHEQRWPKYIGQALALGLRSQLGVHLVEEQRSSVCLNLHSTTHEDFDDGSIGVAEHFARHAALALGNLRRESQLETAIGARTVIGTAIGITMVQYGLDQASAFNHLVRLSSTQNKKLRVIAAEIVDAADAAALAARDGQHVNGARART